MMNQLVWLATQDVMQVLLVVACVCAGWSAWSLTLSFLMAPRDAKQAAKLIAVDDQKLLSPAAEPEAAVGACPASREDAGARGRSLLEHYGVFGAAPGTWEGTATTPPSPGDDESL
jgi:hypothetical protein